MQKDEFSLGLYEKAMPDAMPLEEKIVFAKRTGYDYLELCIDQNVERFQRLDWDKKKRAYWRSYTFDMEMPFKTLSLSALRDFPLGMLDEYHNKKALETIRKAVELAFDMGSRVVLVNGYCTTDKESKPENIERFYENMAKAAAYCEYYGVTIAIENAEEPFCDTIEKATKIVERIDSPYVKVYGDIGNIANAFYEMPEMAFYDLAQGKGKIAALHLKDTQVGEYRMTPYGEGHVDFKKNALYVKALGIRFATAEFFYKEKEDGEEEARNVCAFLREYFGG